MQCAYLAVFCVTLLQLCIPSAARPPGGPAHTPSAPASRHRLAAGACSRDRVRGDDGGGDGGEGGGGTGDSWRLTRRARVLAVLPILDRFLRACVRRGDECAYEYGADAKMWIMRRVLPYPRRFGASLAAKRCGPSSRGSVGVCVCAAYARAVRCVLRVRVLCVCACVRAGARARVCACARVCVVCARHARPRACMRARVCVVLCCVCARARVRVC